MKSAEKDRVVEKKLENTDPKAPNSGSRETDANVDSTPDSERKKPEKPRTSRKIPGLLDLGIRFLAGGLLIGGPVAALSAQELPDALQIMGIAGLVVMILGPRGGQGPAHPLALAPDPHL